MYYVPDGTKVCGYYECKKCGNRFLSLEVKEKIPCPVCEAEIDYEIGPDESLEDLLETAELKEKIRCLWSNKGLTDQYSQNCRDISFDDIEEYGEKLMKIYQGQ